MRWGTTLSLSKPMRPDRKRSVKKEPLTKWQIVNALKKKYPESIGKYKPLVIGAHKQVIAEREPHWPIKQIRTALRTIVGFERYLLAVSADGSSRVNLDGSDAGLVSNEHREFAKEKLRKQNEC